MTDVLDGLEVRTNERYGWVRQLPDKRDFVLNRVHEPETLPNKFVIEGQKGLPAVYDQGQLGSCTANGSGAAFQFARTNAGGTDEVPSRLFIYYNERVVEGTVASDSGAQIRDAMKVIGKWGAVQETDWPYDISKFADKPPAQAYTDGLSDLATAYHAVPQTNSELKSAVYSNKLVVFGFTVYDSFESQAVAQTGIMPMPDVNAEQVLGGHCVDIVGWDDSREVYKVRNSWGSGWGDEGYFYMPYSFAEDSQFASDFWVIDVVMPG